MTPKWIARHLKVPEGATEILVTGYCAGTDEAAKSLQALSESLGVPIQVGPKDLRALPEYFGQPRTREGYGKYDIEIIAEINHAPRLSLNEILAQAQTMSAHGANVIDVGCDPGGVWAGLADCVRALKAEGHRVSVDSLNVAEITAAVEAGAELVLSVNSSNRHAAKDWGCEVIVIPDDPKTLAGLVESVELLQSSDVPFRIDPILEPIAFGFAASLGRYLATREKYPDAEIMMGIGNLTELTDCDSSGINVLLLGFCQEVGIRSILTTQVINWARTSVKECDLARRLMHFAVTRGELPKHTEPGLVMLRDPRVYEDDPATFQNLACDIRDNNFRLFAQGNNIHAITRELHESASDPFLLFERLLEKTPKTIDASHAFYLGFEMCKAMTALQLGKQYRQDESLDWGMLTVAEESHRLRKTAAARKAADE
jgi:dihydropteroate synthase-like protein